MLLHWLTAFILSVTLSVVSIHVSYSNAIYLTFLDSHHVSIPYVGHNKLTIYVANS